MLTGRLYLSNELIGGVFDEANRSLNEVQVQIFDLLLSFCRWSVRGIKIRFTSYYAEQGASRHDKSDASKQGLADALTLPLWTVTKRCNKLTQNFPPSRQLPKGKARLSFMNSRTPRGEGTTLSLGT